MTNQFDIRRRYYTCPTILEYRRRFSNACFFFLFRVVGTSSGDAMKSSRDFPQTFWRYLGDLYLSHENIFYMDGKLRFSFRSVEAPFSCDKYRSRSDHFSEKWGDLVGIASKVVGIITRFVVITIKKTCLM